MSSTYAVEEIDIEHSPVERQLVYASIAAELLCE